MFRRGVALCLALFLVACAGREAVRVEAYQRQDEQLNCAEIDREIGRNNAAMRSRVVEGNDRDGRNAMIGAVGMLLFWPALFALDLKDAPGEELSSLDSRNKTLVQYARERGCNVQVALDGPMAEAEFKALYDEDGNLKEGVQPSFTLPTTETPRPMAVAARTPPVDSSNKGELQELMDAFLSGAIDADEYERRRAALGS